MANDKNKSIKVNPNEIRIRDEAIKSMIATTGGITRVFTDKKKKSKADVVGRKSKHRKELD